MKKTKQRQKVIITTDTAPRLAQEWFKQKIPDNLLVRYNPRKIVHAHSYGGLSKFFKGLTEGTLYGTKCFNCSNQPGNIWLPPRVHCPDCWEEMIWIPVSHYGAKVYTYSTTNYPGASFRGTVPCPLISVEIPMVCTKFMSYLSKFGDGEPYIGMPVRPVFRKRSPTYTILDISWVPDDNHE